MAETHVINYILLDNTMSGPVKVTAEQLGINAGYGY